MATSEKPYCASRLEYDERGYFCSCGHQHPMDGWIMTDSHHKPITEKDFHGDD